MSIEVFGLGLRCVPSFHSVEVLCRRRGFQSQVERSRRGLEGFLARLHHSEQNEGKMLPDVQPHTKGQVLSGVSLSQL